MKNKITAGILLSFFALMSSPLPAQAVTFYGEVPTGLVEMKNFRYPVYLFVPPGYKASRAYPFLMVLPEIGEAPEKAIQKWLGLGKKKGLIILVPELKLRLDDVPYQTDTWILQLKKDVTGRYHTAPDKTFLIGQGESAHYVAYLGLRYPEQFAGAALLGGSWVGSLDKLMTLNRRPKKQIPFFVAVPVAGPSQLYEKTEKKAYELTAKGYPVILEKLEEGKDALSADYLAHVTDWLEEKSASWSKVRQESEKKFKEKVSTGVEEFFSTN